MCGVMKIPMQLKKQGISTDSQSINVINLVDKFRATECTERKKSVIWPTKVTEDARDRMQRSPNKSVKKLAVEIVVSYGSAHKILRNKLEISMGDKLYLLTCLQMAFKEPGGSMSLLRHHQAGLLAGYSECEALSAVIRHVGGYVNIFLYGCETWTLTLREEHRLRVFENKVLRKIFGAKRDEVTGEWRKLHNTELHALYSSPDIIRNIKSRRLRWVGHVVRMGESRNAYRVLVGRPEVKRSLGRPRHRWKDNIKMDLREVGYDDREWINLAQDQWRAYVRAAMNLRGRENPHVSYELEWASPKVNDVWCVVSRCNLYGSFIFAEETVRSGPYLDVLINFFEPQLQQENNMGIVFQQHGAPPH
ncbi:hypothetical protein ANN_08487 [Periplaneta americana]|uniref:Uncharacterized protein n=1 Tax=Periplaneta americana TaxID=6978 RepID=A0ABQ8T282_PERAM|nr:hypothetical protein ANN_08487 [Periplaneta americana]